MWRLGVLIVASILMLVVPRQGDFAQAQTRNETRCGWFSNPTPANAWLIDRDATWTIGIQGGYQAEGDWPDVKEWVEMNVHYGYGCTCVRGTFDRRSKKVLRIVSSYGRPLSACRKDRTLRGKEPK